MKEAWWLEHYLEENEKLTYMGWTDSKETADALCDKHGISQGDYWLCFHWNDSEGIEGFKPEDKLELGD